MGKTYKIEDIPDHLWGIYKINFPSGKNYIGLSTNIKKRIKQHNEDHNFKENLPIYNAIHKYGKVKEVEILEVIEDENLGLLKERERYWIAYYDTTNDDKGYNLNPGGEFCGFMRGSSNPNSKLTDEQVEEIIDLLKNSTKTQKEIAEIFNVSAVTIKRINNGVSYFDVNRQYPIRSREKTNQVRSVQTNINKTKLSEEQLKEVIKLLDETTISMDNIAKKFNICQSTISQINLGRGYAHLEGYEYPIRKSKFHKYN